jgi:hypothetical protein
MQGKIFLLSLLAIVLMIETNAQTKKPAEAKAAKVSETVETALQDMAKTIERTDWSSLTDILTTTVSLIEKHVDAVQQIVQDVDTKPLEKAVEKEAQKLENSQELRAMEKELEALGKRMEALLDSTSKK